MPPYALLLHTVPAHTPNGIPRTESRGTSARSTCAAGSRARLPGVCFRVVRDQELRSARELARATSRTSPPVSALRSLPAQMPPPSPPRAATSPPSVASKIQVAYSLKLMFWWLWLHAVFACASTPPLSSDRGSAAATVTCPSRRAPSAVPPCPAQPTPPLDRSGAGSTPATIYPKARAQHFSCPWRCDRPCVLPQQPAPAQLFSCKWLCERPCALLLPPALQQPAHW